MSGIIIRGGGGGGIGYTTAVGGNGGGGGAGGAGGSGTFLTEIWSKEVMEQFYREAIVYGQAFLEVAAPAAPPHPDAPRALDLEAGRVEARPHPKREIEL